MIVIGVDTGGTFTDFVFKQGNGWGVLKTLSTPSNPAIAVLEGLEQLAAGKKKRIIHGSTVATNAILERKGAKTALITNRGFEDVIEIGRQNRSRLYDFSFSRGPQIVPADLRFGIMGRVLHTGETVESLEEEEVRDVARRMRDLGVESVAICFLFSYANQSHERLAGAVIKSTGLPVSLSHEIVPEFREFERTATTVINAYVSPRMNTYIDCLTSGLGRGDSLAIMQSNGGSISAETARRESSRTILSGPAGGVVGAIETGKAAGYDKLITFDMGGTSTDVCLIHDSVPFTMESKLSGYPVRLPMIDIHTVGAGGGSIAYLDAGGALRVGPESAGADPGPVCYGKGRHITVTDANLFLGRLIPDHFLGGAIVLDRQRLQGYFEDMATETGLSAPDLAEGMLDVTNTAMERAIRVISVERGHDPREFTLFSFGGAGGMHCAFLARLLEIPRVFVPRHPGILSASGMLMADVIKDYSLTIMETGKKGGFHETSPAFQELEKMGVRDLLDEGVPAGNIILERYLDMRYLGQSYEITVPLGDDNMERFHCLHEKIYGYRNNGRVVEIVNIRLRARGVTEKSQPVKGMIQPELPPEDAFVGESGVVFDRELVKSRIFARERLFCGNRIKGPAIVVEYSATTVIPPFAEALVDPYGNMILEIMQQPGVKR